MAVEVAAAKELPVQVLGDVIQRCEPLLVLVLLVCEHSNSTNRGAAVHMRGMTVLTTTTAA